MANGSASSGMNDSRSMTSVRSIRWRLCGRNWRCGWRTNSAYFGTPPDHARPVEPVSDDTILRVHHAAYVEAVKQASSDPHFGDEDRGSERLDDPVSRHAPGGCTGGRRLTAGSAVRASWRRRPCDQPRGRSAPCDARSRRRDSASTTTSPWRSSGCSTRESSGSPIDVDVPHGDGVQAMFWDDPRVMTISIHESLGPRSRHRLPVGGIGGPGAQGAAVNTALPAGTGDQGWLRKRCTPWFLTCSRYSIRRSSSKPRRASTLISRIRSHICSYQSTVSAWPSGGDPPMHVAPPPAAG